MNRLIIQNSNINNTIKISDPQILNHLKNTLKVKIGDLIKICIPGLGLGNARIQAIDKNAYQLEIRGEIIPGQLPWFELWVAACRPQTVKKVLEYGTSMGCSKFIFFKSELMEKSYMTSKIWDESEYQNHLLEGLAQSAIYFQIPSVEIWNHFPHQVIEDRPKYLFHPYSHEDHDILSFSKDNSQQPILAIGGERGFTKAEMHKLVHNLNFTPLKLGKAILRVEVATVAAITVVQNKMRIP